VGEAGDPQANHVGVALGQGRWRDVLLEQVFPEPELNLPEIDRDAS
jgi:hypothetical protein